MNSLSLLTQIQHVALASTGLCLVLYLFRKRRASRIKAVHPILFGSQFSIAIFCACLALRAGLAPEVHLVSFWLGAAGACLAVLCLLLSYRLLWKRYVDVSTRMPWPMPDNAPAAPPSTTPAANPAAPAGGNPEAPPAPPPGSADRIYPDHGPNS